MREETQWQSMRKRWVSSVLPRIKQQDERKRWRGATLPYRYLWGWKRCHCIWLIDIFSINLSRQFLKICNYLATIMSYTEKSCLFFFTVWIILLILRLPPAISMSELPAPLVLFVLFCIKKKMLNEQSLPYWGHSGPCRPLSLPNCLIFWNDEA